MQENEAGRLNEAGAAMPGPPATGTTEAAAAPLRPLDPRVVRAWRAALLVATALVGGAGLLLSLVTDGSVPPPAAIAAVALAGIALAAFWPPARYRAWAFQVRPDDLLVRRGVLWRTVSVVPHARIQYVDTSRGPLERWLGLARVVVYTAGSRGAAIGIPGLAVAEAEALRDRLAALGGSDDAV